MSSIKFRWIRMGIIREYGVVGRGDTSYIFMLCSCRLNKCSISYWQSIMNCNTIKQQIEIIIMKNRWLYSLLLVSIIYLVLFYFNFTAYIRDYFWGRKVWFLYTLQWGVLCVEHANVLELCYIELLSGDSSPYSILSGIIELDVSCRLFSFLEDSVSCQSSLSDRHVYQTRLVKRAQQMRISFVCVCARVVM